MRPVAWLLTGLILGLVTTTELVPRVMGFSPAEVAGENGIVRHVTWWQRPAREITLSSVAGGMVFLLFAGLSLRSWRDIRR